MSGWTLDQVGRLMELAPTYTAEAIAQALGLDSLQIAGKARRLGLQFGADAGPVPAETTVTSASVDTVHVEVAFPAGLVTSAKPKPIEVGHPAEGWSERRDEALKTLTEQGLSSSAIADRLGGISRNAVIGRRNRLRDAGAMEPRTVPDRAAPRPKPRPAPPPKPTPATTSRPKVAKGNFAPIATAAQAEAAAVQYDRVLQDVEAAAAAQDFPHKVDLFALRATSCRYPLWRAGAGRDEPRLYCGAPHYPGSPYCAGHRALCMPPPNMRKAS